MSDDDRLDESAGWRYQFELARTLVGGLGYHGAVDTCLRNGWDSTLAVLMRSAAGEIADTIGRGVRGDRVRERSVYR